jgi:prevent-host-death family protein
MRLSDRVRSISYLKSNAAALLEDLAASGQPIVITQNGEAKAVLQDVQAYDELQESLSMLKLLALSRKSVQRDGAIPLAEAEASILELTRE